MSITSFKSSFLTNPLISTIKPQKFVAGNNYLVSNVVSCRNNSPDDRHKDSSTRRKKVEYHEVGKLVMVTLAAAGVLTLGSVDPASAAKSGGRVGGQAFRPSAPRSSGPRINNSRTNIYINPPPVAPPLVGGYGYGYGYGGWGWSPFSFFAPGPSVAVGIGGGFDTFFLFIVLGAVAAVIRRFLASNQDKDDY